MSKSAMEKALDASQALEPVAYQLRERDNYDLIDADELPLHQDRIEERGGTMTPLYTHPAQAKPLSDEQARALREAHCNQSEETYFKARPQIDSLNRRKLFQAGFERGFNSGLRYKYINDGAQEPAQAKPLSDEQIEQAYSAASMPSNHYPHEELVSYARAVIAEFCRVNGIKETSCQ